MNKKLYYYFFFFNLVLLLFCWFVGVFSSPPGWGLVGGVFFKLSTGSLQ